MWVLVDLDFRARDEESMRNEPLLGLATTGELLDELSARNRIGQAGRFKNQSPQAEDLIIKLRRAFQNRDGGLDYKTVGDNDNQGQDQSEDQEGNDCRSES
jgi:hypothetical protein